MKDKSCPWWNHVEAGPPDLMLKIGEAYSQDPNTDKVDLSAGVYRDELGQPWVLPCVRQAEKKIAEKKLHKEYLPIDGSADFCLNSVKLVLGDDSELIKQGRIAAVQGVAGIGALRVWLEFFSKFHRGPNEVWISDPSYAAHAPILEHLGPVKMYRYYNYEKKCFDYEGVLQDISNMPEGSIILLHPSAHNPSGVDPSPEQWAGISRAIKKGRLFPLIDMAYQGLASGDLDEDATSVRIFARDGHQFALVQTYSKNLGLYGERVGSLSFVTASADEAARVRSQLKIIIRTMYSCPPVNGVRIANEIFIDPDLKRQWIKDLKTMTDRINSIRKALKNELDKTGTKLNWDHVTNQIGMFCFTGMTPEQVKRMREKYSVYASTDGRICMAGVNSRNVELVARALHDATK
ncbi:aspartate aminotransferase, mitochondrial isoform X1 [Neodiprion lecontei]|uniref:Aspartate aminotransferase, mitochondrial n=2 Tax=Neodiprion lecontei TaxID=441921 RepID=A0A6J0BKV9_NEOLC|nr:aspartate aminotransferase, mitochondrial isoform X1 [Neodiprion lecontei]